MVLPDVNVLVYAYRRDSANHAGCRDWLAGTVNADAPYGCSELVLSGFLRVVTHPKVFVSPSRLDEALAFADQLRHQPNAVAIAAGARHWEIFRRLAVEAGARGNLLPDAYLAAMAIENGCEWITTDRDYSRFRGLRWRHPLA